MSQTVLLHTIEDVEHCLQHGLNRQARLFSANVHVVYYLKHHYGLECYDLCSAIKPQEIRQMQVGTLEAAGRLLDELDGHLAPAINGQLNLSMRYFTSLYSVTAARQLSLFILLRRCLAAALAEHYFATVLVYEGPLGPLRSGTEQFLSRLFPQISFRLVRYRPPQSTDKTRISGLRLGDIPGFLLPNGGGQSFKQIRPGRQGVAGPGVLLIEPLDSQRYLGLEPAGTAVYSYDPWSRSIGGNFEYQINRRQLPATETLKAISQAPADLQAPLALLYEAVSDDFCRNLVQHLQLIQAYRRLEAATSIGDVYWEVPPFQGAAALLIEYWLTNKTARVTGVQSRATFFAGQTLAPQLPANLFNRCHRFLTQGATGEDMEALYPGITAKVTIIPPESKEIFKTEPLAKDRKPADVAFYLTPTMSFLQTGHTSSHIAAQEELLRSLNEHQGKNIHIVTYSIPSEENCALFSFINTLRNVMLIRNATQENYLSKYDPKIILLDTPSPYLLEAHQANVPVIMLADPTIVFDKKAQELLEKQLYYIVGLEEEKHLLQLHFNENLQKPLDDTYKRKFCRKLTWQ